MIRRHAAIAIAIAIAIAPGCAQLAMDPENPTAQQCEAVRRQGAMPGKERAVVHCKLQRQQAAAHASDAAADHRAHVTAERHRDECVAATLELWESYEEARVGPSLEDERAEAQRQREMRQADRCYQARADRAEVEWVQVPCPPRGAQGRAVGAFVRAPSPNVPDGCEAHRAAALEAWGGR